jgi:hypothetical protein
MLNTAQEAYRQIELMSSIKRLHRIDEFTSFLSKQKLLITWPSLDPKQTNHKMLPSRYCQGIITIPSDFD